VPPALLVPLAPTLLPGTDTTTTTTVVTPLAATTRTLLLPSALLSTLLLASTLLETTTLRATILLLVALFRSLTDRRILTLTEAPDLRLVLPPVPPLVSELELLLRTMDVATTTDQLPSLALALSSRAMTPQLLLSLTSSRALSAPTA